MNKNKLSHILITLTTIILLIGIGYGLLFGSDYLQNLIQISFLIITILHTLYMIYNIGSVSIAVSDNGVLHHILTIGLLILSIYNNRYDYFFIRILSQLYALFYHARECFDQNLDQDKYIKILDKLSKFSLYVFSLGFYILLLIHYWYVWFRYRNISYLMAAICETCMMRFYYIWYYPKYIKPYVSKSA